MTASSDIASRRALGEVGTVAARRPRVLAIFPYGPSCIRVRAREAVRELVQHAEVVDVICLDDGGPLQCPDGIRKLTVVPNTSVIARALRVLLGILAGRAISLEFYNSRRLRNLLKLIDIRAYDCVYVERLPVHRYLHHPRLIYDCVDSCSHSSRLLAARANGYKRILYGVDALLLPDDERATCNASSLVLVSAERERRHLLQLGVTRPIEVWTHEHRVETLPRPLCERDRFVISFHGKLSFAANDLALRALNEVIAPALDPLRYELRIIGACPPAVPRKYRNLKFTGYVPSILDGIRDSDLSVFPLAISVGFPNKAMESLAAGVPFIATPDVVAGLPSFDEIAEHGVYVRDIAGFVSQIDRYARLRLAERQEIAQRCYEYVQRVYGSPARRTQWERILGGPLCDAPGQN